MTPSDAANLSKNWTGKLVIKDPQHPCAFGTITEDGFGVLYMWTLGHTVPRMICQYTNELPDRDNQLKCVCGEYHDFPDDRKLLFKLYTSQDWEPIFASHPLEDLARQAED